MKILDKLLGKKEFWNLAPLLSKGAMFNFIYGGRDNGKSYAVKEHLITDAWNNDRLFGLVFRREGDKNVTQATGYFNDVIRRGDGYEHIKTISGGKADGVFIRAGDIYFTLDGKKVKPCGYILFLEVEEKYKSGGYTCSNLLFEEVITRNRYLPGELELLDSLVSTVFRNEEHGKVFLIGNLISRVIPYRSGWGLNNLDRQKEGTTDIYQIKFREILIDVAVERCKENKNQSFALSKKGQQAAIGQWEVDEQPKLTSDELYKCTEMYRFVVSYAGYFFLLKFMRDSKNNYFLYCEKKTSKIQPKTRVIGDYIIMDNLYTPGFTPIVERERFVLNLIKLKKMYFSDDLTGADFWVCYNSLVK